jgi:uncharacterized protein with von Willebrand factor type A (vWA) domain
MNLRDRARRLFGRRELSEHAVHATKVDHAVLNDLRRRSEKINEAVTTPPTLPDGQTLDAKVWERLAEDLWTEFFGADEPELRARDKIEERFRVNREVADKQARDESFRETRSMTRGHTPESAMGLLGALNSYRKSYGNELAEHAQRQNEVAQAQDALDDLDDALEKLRQQRREQDDPSSIDEQIRELAKRKRAALGELRAAEADQASHAGDLIDAAKVAVARAAKAAENGVEAASLVPGKGKGAGRSMSPDQMLAFADRVHASPVLRAVLQMMGRMELSMGTTRRQLRKGGYEEMVDIETGNDLRNVLPAEKVLLMHPMGKLDFFRRYHEQSLMQYEMWSEAELKKGPLIFATDGSGSMRGAPNIFARGLTLAACGIANRESRNAAALEFGSAGELREFFFPKERPLDTATALDFAEHFYGGGTDINQVLAHAKYLIDSEAPFHTADLVIVTDGGDRLTEESIAMRDALRAMGVKIHGICIGIKPTPYMIEVCDRVSSVFDFAGPDATSDRLAIDIS